MADCAIIGFPNCGLIVIFICVAFFYPRIKSSGKYRLYSLIIFTGWAFNQVINAIGQLLSYSNVLNFLTLIFSIKIAALLSLPTDL